MVLPQIDCKGYLDPSAANGFSQNRLQRLEKPVSDLEAKFLIFINGKILCQTSNACKNYFFRQENLGWIEKYNPHKVFLGIEKQYNIFALGYTCDSITYETILPKNSDPISLRSLIAQGEEEPSFYGMAAQAKSVLEWHENNQYCSYCGTRSHSSNNGRFRQCPNCSKQHFPRTDPVVIMLGIHKDKCLLGRHHHIPQIFTSLAGFIEPGETIEAAVRRELKEEAGVDATRVQYACSQPWPFPSSLMIGAFAYIENPKIEIEKEELIEAKWFNKEEAAALPINEGQETEAFMIPPPYTIAHRLIAAFLENKTDQSIE